MTRPEDDKQMAREGRRGFLKGAALAGGAAAVAVAAPANAAVEAPVEPEATSSKGYRETAHVRSYYETAAM